MSRVTSCLQPLRLAAAIVLCLIAGSVTAQPEPWLHPDSTWHYYHAVAAEGINWLSAFDSAAGHGGYLATLTSASENDFVFRLVDSSIYWYERPQTHRLAGPWLGGTQDFQAPEPDSGWHWVTNEPWLWQNWTAGQPDNQADDNAIHFGESVGVRVPTMNDLNRFDSSIRGFVRELSADSTTLGLFKMDSGNLAGYILFAPMSSRYTYLIDKKGRLVHSWQSYYLPGASCYLLDNGCLVRAARLDNPVFPIGGTGGRVALIDWNGSLLWSYEYSNNLHCQHHDALPLPNGNILMIAWEYKTREEAIAAGRNPALLTQNKLFPDHLVEVDTANDTIVWEWHVWDHLIQDYDSTKANYGSVRDHPELVDINYSAAPRSQRGFPDWLHSNAVAYNPQFDQIVLCVHNFGEIWVIDHSTTTAEARGHSGGRYGQGGDILYRWGNPAAYRAGDSLDQQLFNPHNCHWISQGLPGAGHMLVFNNGGRRGYSTVDEFIPACDSTGAYPRPAPGTPFGPAAPCWTYRANPPSALYSQSLSSAQRLPNGNTFICSGDDGTLLEVTHDGRLLWKYINPVTDSPYLFQGDTIPGLPGNKFNNLFRATLYPPDFAGFVGRDLTPGYPLEKYRTRQLVGKAEPQPGNRASSQLSAWPNPFRDNLYLHLPQSPSLNRSELRCHIYDATGRLLLQQTLSCSRQSATLQLNFVSLPAGVYYCEISDQKTALRTRVVRQK